MLKYNKSMIAFCKALVKVIFYTLNLDMINKVTIYNTLALAIIILTWILHSWILDQNFQTEMQIIHGVIHSIYFTHVLF